MKNKKKDKKKVGFMEPLYRPSLFMKELKKGMMRGQYIADEKRRTAAKGIEHMEKTRGKKWVNFWLWNPITGFFMFWREGKKVEKGDN